MKKVFFLSLSVLLLACSSPKDSRLRVGVVAGPEAELMQVAKSVAQDQFNLKMTVVEFSDYIQPNMALNEGSVDVNVFQHQPYLAQQIKERHYPLVAIGKTFVYPMGIYSKRFKRLAELPSGITVAIPNDPSNEGRALLLLQQAGLLQLQPAAGLYATPSDIRFNPHLLKFKELDAAQLARSLPDVDLAVINTNYAVPAGLSPTKDALFHENKYSLYANVVVTRQDRVSDPRLAQLIDALHSAKVEQAADKLFDGQAIAAWPAVSYPTKKAAL